MTELYINDRKVVLSANQNIRIILDNVYFTKSSSYSYDIKLPLKHPDNIAVFGHMERLDVSKDVTQYDARLVVAGKLILQGSATIIDIYEDDISIQILSGNSELNCFFSDQYIDSLELGQAETYPDDQEYYPDMDNERNNAYWGVYSDTCKYVYFPIFNINAGVFFNRITSGIRNGNPYIRYSSMSLNGIDLIRTANHAVQPYLCFIIERICNAIGYDLKYNEMESSKLRNIFIANDTITYDFAKTLPHWTVTEFFQEIENLFGVVTIVNEYDKSVSIKFIDTFFNTSETCQLHDVADNTKTEFAEDNNLTYGNSNIGYNLPNTEFYTNYRKIDDDIVRKADIISYPGYSAMNDAFEAMTAKEKKQTILETMGRHHVSIDGILTECNYFRSIFRNDTEDIDIDLNIVPAELMVAVGRCQEGTQLWEGSVVVLTGQDIDLSSDEFSIQSAVEGDWTENTTVRNKMFIAINDGYFNSFKKTDDDTKSNIWPWPYISSENLIENSGTYHSSGLELYSLARNERMKINTHVKTNIYFLSPDLPDPTAVFLINNKRYVCESIELEITDSGIDVMKQGDFYEIV